jgi:ferric-dicitrate binding protein FerR (iron transport regulator)
MIEENPGADKAARRLRLRLRLLPNAFRFPLSDNRIFLTLKVMRISRPMMVVCAFWLACGVPAALAALDGQLMFAEGDVSIRSAGQQREAAIGDRLGAGDIVETGAQSLAVIDLGNGTTIKLRQKTSLAIDSIGQETTVNLRTGGAFANIARKLTGHFSVRTSSAVAGVRGTRFFVAYGRTIDSQPDVWLCVSAGTVEVALPTTGRSVLVNEGAGINIVGGEKLTVPRPYPWTRKLNWNMDPTEGTVVDSTNLDQAYSDLLDQDYD